MSEGQLRISEFCSKAVYPVEDVDRLIKRSFWGNHLFRKVYAQDILEPLQIFRITLRSGKQLFSLVGMHFLGDIESNLAGIFKALRNVHPGRVITHTDGLVILEITVF